MLHFSKQCCSHILKNRNNSHDKSIGISIHTLLILFRKFCSQMQQAFQGRFVLVYFQASAIAIFANPLLSVRYGVFS